MQLADWCRQHQLASQERAHLIAALQVDPNHAAARQRLDYVLVGGAWLSRPEVETARGRAKETLRAMQLYTSKLQKIRRALAQSKPRLDYALNQLLEIKDPSAIPAMELILSASGENGALCVVEAVACMKAPEASLSLARHALLCPWDDAREAAMQKLKTRDEHSFIPSLLATLITPWQAQAEIVSPSGRRLLYRHMFYCEGEDKRRLVVLDQAFGGPGNPQDGLPSAWREVERAVSSLEFVKLTENAQITNWNKAVGELLRNVTGEPVPDLADE